MNASPVRLLLGGDTRATLRALLAAVLELPEGSRVVDHLPINPWGDVDEFRRQIYLPLHALTPSPEYRGTSEVIIEPPEAALIRDVLDGLAESVSGGNPWVALSAPERAAVMRLADQLTSISERADAIYGSSQQGDCGSAFVDERSAA